MKTSSIVSAGIATLVIAVSGCATQKDLEATRDVANRALQDAAAAKSAADAATAAAVRADTSANNAQNTANHAMQAAQASQATADASNEKINRMFEKVVSK